MSVGDIIAAGQQIYQAGNSLLSLANKYEERSASWNAFFGNVALLQATCERLNERVQSSQVSLLVSEVRAFEAAQRQVDDVVRNLKAEEDMGNDRRTWVLKIMFSEKVAIQLDAATKLIKEWEEYFEKVQTNAEDVTERRVQRLESRRAALTCSDPSMNLYIPFQDTERRIFYALQESAKGGAHAVMVFGRGGQGKSSMVRHMASTLEQDVSDFGNVFFMECGRQADVAAIQTVLLQWLGADAPSREGEALEKQSGTKNSTTAVKSTKELLRLRLQKERVLIMLDDVWNFDFLQEFLKLRGPSTTFLVTSRQDICKDTGMEAGKSYQPIQMEALKLDDAEQIFAVHAGLPGRRIPPDCKDIARGLFDRADYHPLVIAQLGAQLGKAANRLNMGIWEALVSDFPVHLDKKHSKPVSGHVYPLSFSGVTEKSYDDMSDRAKHLFVLLGMCKGPSVSDAVLHFLFQTAFPTLKCTKLEFSQMKFELESRQFLSSSDESSTSIHDLVKDFIMGKLTEKVNDFGNALSLHSFQKSQLFSLQELGNTIGYLARSFAKCCPWWDLDPTYQDTFQGKTAQTGVITILSCLYLDPESDLTAKFVSRSGYSSATFSELKRNTVKPITEKLVEELTFQIDSSPTESSSPAIEVFLEFICNDSLLHGNISKLLGHKAWVHPALGFLKNLRYLDQSFWTAENKSLQTMGSHLLDLLSSAASSDILEQAKKALWGLCACQDSTSHRILCTPDFLQKLDQLLCQNPTLQSSASGALANLASGCDQDAQEICNISVLLNHLVRSLAAYQSSGLREQAARAIRNLSASMDRSSQNILGSFPNLLEGLGECLTKKDYPKLQLYSAGALARVACGNDDVCKSKIIQVANMLDRLVQCLGDDNNSDLQELAAWAVCNLAATSDLSILNILGSFPNLLEGLGECLTKKDYPKLQVIAAGALAKVTWGNDDVRKSKIIEVANMLDRLVGCLVNDSNSDLQELAALALGNLAATNDLSILTVLGSFPNLLEGLGECLSNQNQPKLQSIAIVALRYVAQLGNDACKSRMFYIPKMLEKLVECTIQHLTFELQIEAANVLQELIRQWNADILDSLEVFQTLLDRLEESLTDENMQAHSASVISVLANKGDGTLKIKILGSSSLVQQLIYCISQDHNACLQSEATFAIRNLAATGDTVILDKMVNFPDLLHKLGCAVTNERNLPMRTHAAWALANLAGADDTVSWYKVVNIQHLLDILMQMPGSEGVYFDEDEARALGNVARLGDVVIDRMASSRVLMEWLTESLLPSWNPLLREHAAWALGNIVSTEDDKIKQKVGKFPGLRDKLVRSLDGGGYVAFKTQVARVLSNLPPEVDDDVIKDRIKAYL